MSRAAPRIAVSFVAAILFGSPERIVQADPQKTEATNAKGNEARDTHQVKEQVLNAELDVYASSARTAVGSRAFDPAKLFDHDLRTSWQADDSDEEPQIRIEFASGVLLTGVAIANGSQAADEFKLTKRIAMARLVFDDDTAVAIKFEPDARGLVKFSFPSKRTKSLNILIDGTVQDPGAKNQRLAISEIVLLGPSDVASASTPSAAKAAQVPLPQGWETLKLDTASMLTAVARGKCKVDKSYRTCTVCRDSKLAFPCIEATFANGAFVGASFELSRSWTGSKAEKQLEADWGRPSAVDPPPNSMTCWDEKDVHAALAMRGEFAGKAAGSVVLMVLKGGTSMCSTGSSH